MKDNIKQTRKLAKKNIKRNLRCEKLEKRIKVRVRFTPESNPSHTRQWQAHASCCITFGYTCHAFAYGATPKQACENARQQLIETYILPYKPVHRWRDC